MKKERKIVYFDMDNVLVNLGKKIDESYSHLGDPTDEVEDMFKEVEPMPGAVDAFKQISESDKYEAYILSTAPWNNPASWTHKRLWVEKHLGENAYKRLILSHNKQLCIGHYLIDDRTKNGAGEFTGEHIHFGQGEFLTWESVLDYLKV
jgi:5'(3')-deoxyribonucleotidase